MDVSVFMDSRVMYLPGTEYDGITFAELADELIPSAGQADTVAGEILRALSRVIYRYFNDGDMAGVDYGNETCNAPLRYLDLLDTKISNVISKMWDGSNNNYVSENIYENCLYKLAVEIAKYIEQHPELIEKHNTKNMFSFSRPQDSEYDVDEDEY